MIFADLTLDPLAILAWIVLGLAAAWLVSKVMGDATYGKTGDLILGAIGGLAGGFTLGLFIESAGFWGSNLAAVMGACIFVGGARTFAVDRGA